MVGADIPRYLDSPSETDRDIAGRSRPLCPMHYGTKSLPRVAELNAPRSSRRSILDNVSLKLVA